MKSCTGCKEKKPFTEFQKCSRSNDGFNWYCRICASKIRRASYLKHREKTLATNARWRDANRERMRTLAIEWKMANLDRYRQLVKRWKSLPHSRLHASVSARIRDSLRGKKMGRGVEAIIGYSIESLKVHLERQFTGGMTWDNYGEWHIDHIRALSDFSVDDVQAAWALPNLRPLWSDENVRKSATRTHLI